MDNHTIIEILLTLVAFFGGMFVKSLNDSVRILHTQDTALADKIHAIETLVAGQYVKSEELDTFMTAVFKKLDRIEDKLDGKADKCSHSLTM